jgi:dTDP-glucose pyrophosphorylase
MTPLMIDIRKHIIRTHDVLKIALEKLNNVPGNLTLFVLDKNEKMVGTLTDGDVRRGLINGKSVLDTVECFMTRDFSYIHNISYSVEAIRHIKQKGVKLLPVLDESGKIERVIDFNKVETILPVEAILMAGGRGERLRPLTDDLPKPLLKIGAKPIIEHNIDRLMKYGVHNFTISLGYLGEMIEDYLGNGNSKGISINFVKENMPLGTIGALGLIKEFRHDDLLIMNSDLFTNIDFEDFYQTFCNEKADVCIATVPYNIDVPYGVFNIQEDIVITDLKEKPRYTYYANAGIYMVRKSVIKNMSNVTKTDATDFILKTIKDGFRVVKYPIVGYWIDIGKAEDFKKAQEFAQHVKY